MDFNRLFRRARKAVDDRGGTDALKKDAEELRDIAKGPGSLGDKAKAAGQAVKDPGAPGQDTHRAEEPRPAEGAPPPSRPE
jgi:hypothetical protein